MNESNLQKNNDVPAIRHNDFLQMMPLEQATEWYQGFTRFVKSILKDGLDYGSVQGTNAKPSLLKPGAEKLRFVYGMTTEMEVTEKVVDLRDKFVSFSYKCSAKSKSGQILAQCEGNCNSAETKYAYLWKGKDELPAGADLSKFESKVGKKLFEFEFAVNKAETSGQYGKPAEYWEKFRTAIQNKTAKKVMRTTKKGDMPGWELSESSTMYKVPNPDVVGLQNTIMKMSQKRAFVGAVLMATGASEFFTQDIEDMAGSGIEDPYNDGKDFEDAEVLQEDHAVKEIPEAWLKKAANCKEPADVDAVIEKNKDTITANVELQELLFNRRKELWKAKLDQCQSPEDVDALFVRYASEINPYPEVRKMFVHRKNDLKPPPETSTTSHNHDAIVKDGKPLVSNKQFKDAMDQIKAGELDVYYKITADYSLESTQARLLQDAYTEARDARAKKGKENVNTADSGS